MSEELKFDAFMPGAVGIQLCQASGKLACSTFVITVDKVVKTDGNLDEALQEKPIGSPCPMPEVLERIVTLKERAAIELFNPPRELFGTHRRSIRKPVLKFKRIVTNGRGERLRC